MDEEKLSSTPAIGAGSEVRRRENWRIKIDIHPRSSGGKETEQIRREKFNSAQTVSRFSVIIIHIFLFLPIHISLLFISSFFRFCFRFFSRVQGQMRWSERGFGRKSLYVMVCILYLCSNSPLCSQLSQFMNKVNKLCGKVAVFIVK